MCQGIFLYWFCGCHCCLSSQVQRNIKKEKDSSKGVTSLFKKERKKKKTSHWSTGVVKTCGWGIQVRGKGGWQWKMNKWLILRDNYDELRFMWQWLRHHWKWRKTQNGTLRRHWTCRKIKTIYNAVWIKMLFLNFKLLPWFSSILMT